MARHSYHGDVIYPRVQGVAGDSEIRLCEFVMLRPSERRVPQPLLDDGVEPGQQEVQAGTLSWWLNKTLHVKRAA